MLLILRLHYNSKRENNTMFKDSLLQLLEGSGFAALTWQSVVMIVVACMLMYLAIVKKISLDLPLVQL